ncbi:hypothetical protein F8A10_12290 [Paracoccus kondratievae]|uniref:DUF5329 domain-containing protein n=1 Tax=Paracoccus kondratievae TaxID=135740 RepID=A0AAD3P0C7_9RHOB|nr:MULTISPECIES: DUF5329 domain-containing protein [Paracoccus]QFQ88289.1 hypothetical protein F8A10_12290 [Paracoccus kondratievae]GLK65272.1 hypothetical protein GCM10017635_27460 [Paracoccus kondratievae]SMG54209.1 hypothetical protein SAMN02746000_03534 [Paracoccus sp. J56]
MSAMKPAALALLVALAHPAQAEAPPPVVAQEIEALLDSIESSGCRFNRNGTWYAAEKVRPHLQTKLDYIAKRGKLTSTEQFIDLAASKSSVSGKPYLIQCGSDPEQASRAWLLQKLKALRS